MLSTIIWYFLFIILSLASALASTSRNWPRPRPWLQSSGLGLGLGLGLRALASASVSASRFWPRLTSLKISERWRLSGEYLQNYAQNHKYRTCNKFRLSRTVVARSYTVRRIPAVRAALSCLLLKISVVRFILVLPQKVTYVYSRKNMAARPPIVFTARQHSLLCRALY